VGEYEGARWGRRARHRTCSMRMSASLRCTTTVTAMASRPNEHTAAMAVAAGTAGSLVKDHVYTRSDHVGAAEAHAGDG
jgi:hypothetical protein